MSRRSDLVRSLQARCVGALEPHGCLLDVRRSFDAAVFFVVLFDLIFAIAVCFFLVRIVHKLAIGIPWLVPVVAGTVTVVVCRLTLNLLLRHASVHHVDHILGLCVWQITHVYRRLGYDKLSLRHLAFLGQRQDLSALDRQLHRIASAATNDSNSSRRFVSG